MEILESSRIQLLQTLRNLNPYKSGDDHHFCDLVNLVRKSSNILKEVKRPQDMDNTHIISLIERKMTPSTGGRKVRLCSFKIPCHQPIYRIVSSRFHHDENYVDFKIVFENIMPTTSCNSNIVLHGLTIVAWAHTRTIDSVYTYK